MSYKLLIHPNELNINKMSILTIPVVYYQENTLNEQLLNNNNKNYKFSISQCILDKENSKFYKIQPVALFQQPYNQSLENITCLITNKTELVTKTDFINVGQEPYYLLEFNPFLQLISLFINSTERSEANSKSWKERLISEAEKEYPSDNSNNLENIVEFINEVFSRISLQKAPYMEQNKKSVEYFNFSEESYNNYLKIKAQQIYEFLKENMYLTNTIGVEIEKDIANKKVLEIMADFIDPPMLEKFAKKNNLPYKIFFPPSAIEKNKKTTTKNKESTPKKQSEKGQTRTKLKTETLDSFGVINGKKQTL